MDGWSGDDRHGISGPHSARDGSQRRVNRDVKQRRKEMAKTVVFVQTRRAHGHLRQAAWANSIRTCEKDCQKQTGCSHTHQQTMSGEARRYICWLEAARDAGQFGR